jgi:hypothetical protein
MNNPYDVHIEFVKEEMVTIDADNADEAQAKAQEWAEKQVNWNEFDDVRIVAVNVNMEY